MATLEPIVSSDLVMSLQVSPAPVEYAEVFAPNHIPRTIDELMRLRAFQQPNEPILAYPIHDRDYVEYTYRELDVFAFRVAQDYALRTRQRQSPKEKERVVALLGPSNLDYLISTLALTKLGFTVLFLSTRLSDAAYLSLLQNTQCSDLFIHKSFSKTAGRIQETMADLSVHAIAQSSSYGFSIPETNHSTCLASHLDPENESNKICWIIHSSGSTGLPKPILQTHSAALRK